MRVAGETVGSVGAGLCLLVGIGEDDSEADVHAAVEKIVHIRIFPDQEGRMNRSLVDVAGEVLIVSQFTLLADIRKGRRPSFTGAADPTYASALIDRMVQGISAHGVSVATGEFGAKMEVELVNDGPVTILAEVRQGVVG